MLLEIYHKRRGPSRLMAILVWHIIQDGEVIGFARILHWDEWLGVPALERGVLSTQAGPVEVAGVLHPTFPHSGNKQQLLPPADREGVFELAPDFSRWLYLCGKGQPLHHPHQAA